MISSYLNAIFDQFLLSTSQHNIFLHVPSHPQNVPGSQNLLTSTSIQNADGICVDFLVVFTDIISEFISYYNCFYGRPYARTICENHISTSECSWGNRMVLKLAWGKSRFTFNGVLWPGGVLDQELVSCYDSINIASTL